MALVRINVLSSEHWWLRTSSLWGYSSAETQRRDAKLGAQTPEGPISDPNATPPQSYARAMRQRVRQYLSAENGSLTLYIYAYIYRYIKRATTPQVQSQFCPNESHCRLGTRPPNVRDDWERVARWRWERSSWQGWRKKYEIKTQY